MDFIARLYKIEEHINTNKLTGDNKHDYRSIHSKPIVDQFFAWCSVQLQRHELTPQHKLRKALNYVISRETELRVFLEDPQVPMDTNYLEREMRSITLGRKNWLLCWTELGAEHVGLIQSLISTCKLHGINPNTYFTDVLQRISIHPASQVADLTPRVWKEKFAENPLRSVLHRKPGNIYSYKNADFAFCDVSEAFGFQFVALCNAEFSGSF